MKTWVARVAASLFLVLGALVFSSAMETGSALLFAMAAAGLGGAVLLIFGIERPGHPLAGAARRIGWLSMFAFSLVPTSFLFLPALVALGAAPAVFGSGADRSGDRGASRDAAST